MEVAGRSDKEIKRDVPQILDIVGLAKQVNNIPWKFQEENSNEQPWREH